MAELVERLQAALGSGYRIVRELGGGGMSRVFLAEDVRLGRRVVVKVLLPELTVGASVERFERETRLAAKLQHPHIVPLLSAGSSQELLYYSMPYVEGESLRARLVREAELPVAEVLRILRDVLDALAYAHRHQVVHRDIKPDNVLLSEGHALVTDFGVAKAVAESTGRQTLTSLGVALGTPLYMSPEQASADPHADHRADIYSLGAMAYEMLCGRPPFTGMTAQAVLAAHMTDAPEAITKHRTAVPEGLNALILRCLEKRPADRYQRAEEMLAHVEAFLTPTAGTPPVISSGTQATIARAHPARVVALFGLASVGVLAIVYALMQLLGLPDWVFWGAIGLLAVGLPVALLTGHHERRRALARATGVAAVPAAGVPAWFTWRRALLAAGVGFAGLGVVTAGYMAMRVLGIGPVGTLIASGVLEEGGRIVLADFTDRTGDTALATTFTEAFRVDLSQSRALRLVPATDLRGALQRMQRDPRSRLTAELAREVAVREGLKAIVTGEINAAGGGFVLSAELLEPESGNVIVAFRENAGDSTQIIRAMDRLSKRLRERAGESLRAIRAAPPLDRVTTTSLPALRKYSLAQRTYDDGDALAAVGLLQEAVALDTTFAEAYRRLGTHLGNLGIRPSARLAAYAKAYEYRDRLPDAERYRMIASYRIDVLGDYRGALEAYARVLETDSTDGIALNNSGITHMALRELDAAAEVFARASALYPQSALYRNNLIGVQLDRGALDQARSGLEDFRKVLPDHPTRWMAELDVAWALGLRDSVAVLGRAVLGRYGNPVSTRSALLRLSILAAVRGRPSDLDQYEEADIRLLESLGLPNEALRDRARLALLRLGLGVEAQVALKPVEEALGSFSAEQTDPLDGPYLDLAALYWRAGRLDRARDWVRRYEQNVPPQWRRGRSGTERQYLRALGTLAGQEGRVQEAIQRFRESDYGNCAPCALPQLAWAYDLGGEPDSARALYQRYLTTPSSFRWAVDGLQLPAALKRLGELYEAAGNRQKAMEYYDQFAELWKNADPELQPVVRDVRERIARLAGERQ